MYTKDALLFLRCASPDERVSWAAALGDAARELYAPDELEAKREAERALLPLLLRQNALQFQRRNLLRANLAVAGKVTAARVRRVKQGYLRFERAKYVAQRSERAAATAADAAGEDEDADREGARDEDEDDEGGGGGDGDAAAAASPEDDADAWRKPTERRWKRYYCALREDATLAYAHDGAALRRGDARGVVALTHARVVLRDREIARDGKLVFELVTPLRRHVLCAPSKAALEDWLGALARVLATHTDARETVDASARARAALARLEEMRVADVDLPALLDAPEGRELYERYMDAREAATGGARALAGGPGGDDEDDVRAAWSCWLSIAEWRELDEAGEFARAAERRDGARAIAAAFLDDDAPTPLPDAIDERAKERVSARLRRGAPPDFDGLQFQCAKFLHRRTFAALRASPDFEPVACALTQPDAEREVFEQPDELEDGAGDRAGEYAADGAGDGAGDDEGDDAFSHDEASSRLLIGSRDSISLASEATAPSRGAAAAPSRDSLKSEATAPPRGAFFPSRDSWASAPAPAWPEEASAPVPASAMFSPTSPASALFSPTSPAPTLFSPMSSGSAMMFSPTASAPAPAIRNMFDEEDDEPEPEWRDPLAALLDDPDVPRVLAFTPAPNAAVKAPFRHSRRVRMIGERLYVRLKPDAENRIGRDPASCQVVLNTDFRASRQHAKVECTPDGRVLFSDLGSSRGSRVNDRLALGRRPLRAGDRIAIGATELLFLVGDLASERDVERALGDVAEAKAKIAAREHAFEVARVETANLFAEEAAELAEEEFEEQWAALLAQADEPEPQADEPEPEHGSVRFALPEDAASAPAPAPAPDPGGVYREEVPADDRDEVASQVTIGERDSPAKADRFCPDID